jgi:hypothetical protein
MIMHCFAEFSSVRSASNTASQPIIFPVMPGSCHPMKRQICATLQELNCKNSVRNELVYLSVEGCLLLGGQVDELDEDIVREKTPAYWSGRFFSGLIRYLRAAKGGLMKLRAHLAQPDSLGIALLAAASSQLLCVQVELDGRGSLEVFPDAAIISVFEYKSSQSGALPAPVNCCPAAPPVLPANRGGFMGGGQIFLKHSGQGYSGKDLSALCVAPLGRLMTVHTLRHSQTGPSITSHPSHWSVRRSIRCLQRLTQVEIVELLNTKMLAGMLAEDIKRAAFL